MDDAIEVLNLVIPKPDIPVDIAQNYKQVKVQWTEQLVATQQKKTEEIKKETELMKVRFYTSLSIEIFFVHEIFLGLGRCRTSEEGFGNQKPGENLGERGRNESIPDQQ